MIAAGVGEPEGFLGVTEGDPGALRLHARAALCRVPERREGAAIGGVQLPVRLGVAGIHSRALLDHAELRIATAPVLRVQRDREGEGEEKDGGPHESLRGGEPSEDAARRSRAIGRFCGTEGREALRWLWPWRPDIAGALPN